MKADPVIQEAIRKNNERRLAIATSLLDKMTEGIPELAGKPRLIEPQAFLDQIDESIRRETQRLFDEDINRSNQDATPPPRPTEAEVPVPALVQDVRGETSPG